MPRVSSDYHPNRLYADFKITLLKTGRRHRVSHRANRPCRHRWNVSILMLRYCNNVPTRVFADGIARTSRCASPPPPPLSSRAARVSSRRRGARCPTFGTRGSHRAAAPLFHRFLAPVIFSRYFIRFAPKPVKELIIAPVRGMSERSRPIRARSAVH